MDTIRIPIGKSGNPVAWATIDIEDYERVSIYRWYLSSDGYPFVAYSQSADRRTTYLHNYVLGREAGSPGEIDHIDRDKLNACKSNLRVSTRSENNLNTRSSIRKRDNASIAKRLRSEGISIEIIAIGLGVSTSTVYSYFKP